MTVGWKIHILVERRLIRETEEISSGHCQHLLSGREATVVTHDAAHQTTAEQHICSFKQTDLGSLFPCGNGSCAACPSSADDYDLHKSTSLLIALLILV